MSAPTLSRPSTASAARPPARQASSGVHRTLLATLACMLGAVALKALFRDTVWLFEVWASMIVVITPAIILRARREPAPWHVWPGLVLLVPWLTLLFLRQHAYGDLIPSVQTWHDVSAQLRDLHRTSANEVAPIITTTAVRLVLCAMLGLLMALVDLVAVVGRHGALGGIPLLVIFTVAGAVPKHSVSWVLFLVAAIGFLILLSLDADDTLQSWGRRIPRPGGGIRHVHLRVSAARTGLVALMLAVLLPLVIPARNTNLLRDLFHGSGGGGIGLGGTGGRIDPFVALKGELLRTSPKNLFTVHLTSRGGRTPFYARVNVLSDYTGKGWVRGASDDDGDNVPIQSTLFDTSPPDEVATPTTTYQAEISVSGLGGNPPVFDRPYLIDGVGQKTEWSKSEQLLIDDDVQSGQQITESWRQPAPTIDQLEHATGDVPPEVSSLTDLPANLPQYVRSLVARVTSGVGTPFQKALRINDYFTNPANGFVYSLETKDGDSGSDLVDFLKNKQGFCQQYAAAMAVMLRVAGVPSRVVLGYTHPVPDSDGTFVVTTNEAHSWVEAYLPGIGWTPFDPTPLAGIAGGSASDLTYAPHPSTSASIGGREPTQTPTSLRTRPDVTQPGTSPTGPTTQASSDSGTTIAGWLVLAGLLVVAVVVLAPALLRETRRRRRLRAAVRARDPDPLWAELADTAVDLGYVWSPARTPRQVADWLAPDTAGAEPALRGLAGAVEAARYGHGTLLADGDPAGLWAQQLDDVTRELRGRRRTRTRLSARLWPASLRLTRLPAWLRPRGGKRH